MPDVIEVGSVGEANAVMQRIISETVQRFHRVNFRRVLRHEVIPLLQNIHEQHFNQETAPDGTPWAPLAPSTILKKGHDRILEETLALVMSLVAKNIYSIARIRHQGTGETLEYGTNRPHAWRHQAGEGVTQREFLGITQQQLDQITAIIADDAVKQVAEPVGQFRAAS